MKLVVTLMGGSREEYQSSENGVYTFEVRGEWLIIFDPLDDKAAAYAAHRTVKVMYEP